MNRRISLFFVTAAMSLLMACNSDYHYANSFLRKFETNKKTATEQIYVALPKEVIHTNSSLNDIPGFFYMSENQQDSVISSLTEILDKINDSIFLDQFNSAFLFTLSRSCIPIVVVDDPSKLPPADDTHFTVSFPQLEAEEFVQRHRSDFQTKKGVYYAYDYDLRHFSTNVWLIFDARDTNSQVYFRNDEVEETFRGTVRSIKDGKATLATDFKRIDINDAYRSARRLGFACATLYVEKILSEYVCRTKGINETYFIYDPSTNTIDDILPYDEGIQQSFIKL